MIVWLDRAIAKANYLILETIAARTLADLSEFSETEAREHIRKEYIKMQCEKEARKDGK